MINVLRDAGYDVRQSYDEGVIGVAFDIDPTERSLAVMAEREHRADAESMRALFRPASVLVVADGEREGRVARAVARSIAGSGYGGAVRVVAGLPDDGVGPVDLVLVGAPADRVAAIVDHAGRLGARAAVVLSWGFGETGPEGLRRQADLVRAARDRGMRLVGPQSFGLVTDGALGRLNATPCGDPPPAGGVGLFCQSAAAGHALFEEARARRVGLGTFVSAGNRADVSGNDVMQFWVEDAATTVAAVYLESIGNPRKFTRVARRLSAAKPVVAVVSGRTGQVVPAGHPVRTSREPPRVLEELLRQAGVVRVGDTRELLDVAMLLQAQPLPAGDRVAVLTNSASQTGLLAEVVRAHGLDVAAGGLALAPDADAGAYRAALEELEARSDWDALVVAHVPVLAVPDRGVAAAIAEAAARSARPTAAFVLGLRGCTEDLSHADGERVVTVPAFASGEGAVRALAAAARYARWRRAERGVHRVPPGVDHRRAVDLVRRLAAEATTAGPVTLDRHRTAEVLAHYGIGLWPTRTVRTADEAVAAARDFGWPVAVKTADVRRRPRLDLGGVRLDLAGEGEVRDAVGHLLDGRREGALEVQPMAPRGVACTVRATEDALYGPVVSFGIAGDAVELLGDVAYGIPPLTDVDVGEMVRAVRAAPRLFGYGGAPPADVAALEDLLARVAALADDLPEVAHLALDPVVVGERGLVVLAARLEVARPTGGGDRRRVLPG